MRSALSALVLAAVLAWGALFSSPAAAEPCRAPVLVEGHGVPAPVVEELAAVSPALFEDVARRLDLSSCAPVRVDLLPAIEGAERLDPPWRLPDWAAGAAVPHERRIVVAVTASGRRQDRERVLHHELAHIGVREAAGTAPVPRWLDEGFARVVAGEHSSEDLAVLARARVGDRLFPLGALADAFPARGDHASLAYAQSGRAVSLLEATEPGAVARVLAGLQAGKDIDQSLDDVVGRRTWQLDVDIEKSIPLWRAWAVLGWETDLALALAALATAWAGLRARRRIRERMVALGDLEALIARRFTPPDVVLSRWTVKRSSLAAS